MAERVWDKFLSEQDRADIAGRPAGSVGFGDRPCLLLIDLYRSAFGERPMTLLESVKEYPSSTGMAAWNALPHIERLLGAAREAGIPVVHSTNNRQGALSPWFQKSWSGKQPRGSSPADDLTVDPIMPSLMPTSEELLIVKGSASAFWGTPLVGHLVGLGVDTVIVAGETTSGCVRAAVVDGCQWRFKMIVAEECVFDRHEASHAINLFDMHRKYADVLSLAEVLEHLKPAE